MIITDWSRYPNFSESEFVCACGCGRCEMHEGFISAVQNLRVSLAVPLIPTSGFRCEEHNARIGGAPGSAHTDGLGADFVRPHGANSARLIHELRTRFNGIGVRLHGDNQYFHIDLKPRQAFWTYA